VVADGVVVGDREEVEAVARREQREFGHGQLAVGVHGVGVQVTGEPAPPRPGRQVPGRGPVADG
jgi:hypothetical protein